MCLFLLYSQKRAWTIKTNTWMNKKNTWMNIVLGSRKHLMEERSAPVAGKGCRGQIKVAGKIYNELFERLAVIPTWWWPKMRLPLKPLDPILLWCLTGFRRPSIASSDAGKRKALGRLYAWTVEIFSDGDEGMCTWHAVLLSCICICYSESAEQDILRNS